MWLLEPARVAHALRHLTNRRVALHARYKAWLTTCEHAKHGPLRVNKQLLPCMYVFMYIRKTERDTWNLEVYSEWKFHPSHACHLPPSPAIDWQFEESEGEREKARESERKRDASVSHHDVVSVADAIGTAARALATTGALPAPV